MSYIWFILSIIVGIYAVSYGRWLKQHSNRMGAAFLYLITLASIGISVYNLLKQVISA